MEQAIKFAESNAPLKGGLPPWPACQSNSEMSPPRIGTMGASDWAFFVCTAPGKQDESLVTVEFESESANTTHLTLVHSRFAQDDACTEHKRGWIACLAKLEEAWAA